MGELVAGLYETEVNGGNGLASPVAALVDQGLSKLIWPVTAASAPAVQPPAQLPPYKEKVGLNGAMSAA